MNIPLSSPDLNDLDKAAVLEVLSSRTLSFGPKLQDFESAAARAADTDFAVAVNSGTSGLHLCVRAAGIREGDEVITTPFSFVASANCVIFENAKPVFVDIDPVTYNIDPAGIEAAVTSRTKAILPVHVFGRPYDADRINEIARLHGLTVIEDCCEAIGARHHGKRAGSLGDMGVFAFYPNKQITTGEGGMIVTNSRAVAEQCRSMRNQGRGTSGGWLEHETLGFNYRLSDLNCALGLSQLNRIENILRSRTKVAAMYTEGLRDIPEIIPPRLTEPGCEISWFVYVVRLADEFTRDHRDEILRQLTGKGVACRNYFSPIHLQPLYQNRFRYVRGAFPICEHVSDRTLALPFFNQLTESQVDYVCQSLKEAIATSVKTVSNPTLCVA